MLPLFLFPCVYNKEFCNCGARAAKMWILFNNARSDSLTIFFFFFYQWLVSCTWEEDAGSPVMKNWQKFISGRPWYKILKVNISSKTTDFYNSGCLFLNLKSKPYFQIYDDCNLAVFVVAVFVFLEKLNTMPTPFLFKQASFLFIE